MSDVKLLRSEYAILDTETLKRLRELLSNAAHEAGSANPDLLWLRPWGDMEQAISAIDTALEAKEGE